MTDDGHHDDNPLARTLKIPEAATRLDVSIKTVERMIGDGRLAAFDHGGFLRIPHSEIDDYFARKKAEASKRRAARAKSRHRPKPPASQLDTEPKAAVG